MPGRPLYSYQEIGNVFITSGAALDSFYRKNYLFKWGRISASTAERLQQRSWNVSYNPSRVQTTVALMIQRPLEVTENWPCATALVEQVIDKLQNLLLRVAAHQTRLLHCLREASLKCGDEWNRARPFHNRGTQCHELGFTATSRGPSDWTTSSGSGGVVLLFSILHPTGVRLRARGGQRAPEMGIASRQVSWVLHPADCQ
jgi:hypothetical protein